LPNYCKAQVDPVVEEVVREVAVWTQQRRRWSGRRWRGPSGRGGGGVDLMVEEEEQRRRLQSVVVVAEPLPYTSAMVMAGWMSSR
jgi:hypothetical protein